MRKPMKKKLIPSNMLDSRSQIWRKSSLTDNTVIQTHNHLVHTQTLNHLAKLVKWPKLLKEC